MHIDAACPSEELAERDSAGAFARATARLAYQALLMDVALTPKPGLVDRRNSGAHRDMNLTTFVLSARAIAPWFQVFFHRGRDYAGQPAMAVLARLRSDGLACERVMLAATGGVNTHKGSIFAFGLLCAAAGRLAGQDRPIDRLAICAEVASICNGIVEIDLVGACGGSTAGERLFLRHGMTGARGEAASGFSTVRQSALPAFDRTLAATKSRRSALFAALLELLAVNQDTNLVSRGGLDGLAFVQQEARRLQSEGGVQASDFLIKMAGFDDALIERNLSPGGSADLLAVTWFLAGLPRRCAAEARSERLDVGNIDG